MCDYHIVKHGCLDYGKVSKSYFFIGVIRLDGPFKVKKLSYSNNFLRKNVFFSKVLIVRKLHKVIQPNVIKKFIL